MPDPAKLFLGPRPDSVRLQTSPSLDTGGEQRPDPTPSRGIAPVDINRGQVHDRGHGAPSPPDEAGTALTFSVLGRPLPAGSKSMVPIIKGGEIVGRRIVETGNRQAKAQWRDDIRHAATAAMNGRRPFTGPVAMSVRFWLRRPKHHHGTGRNEGVLKASAPSQHLTTPDVLKLARGLEDALQGICYVNDSQIIDEHLAKRFGNVERTEVTLMNLSSEDTAA